MSSIKGNLTCVPIDTTINVANLPRNLHDDDVIPAGTPGYRNKPLKKSQLKPGAIPSLHMGTHISEGNKHVKALI